MASIFKYPATLGTIPLIPYLCPRKKTQRIGKFYEGLLGKNSEHHSPEPDSDFGPGRRLYRFLGAAMEKHAF